MIIGIDSGITGAISIMQDNGALFDCFDMPVLHDGKRRLIDTNTIKGFIRTAKAVIIEKAQSMPGNGGVAMFNYGMSYGVILGLCEGLNVPVHPVHPATWKKVMLKDMPKGKDSSIIKASQLYPTLKFTRKKDHGMAEATLLALYGIKYILR